MSQILPFTEANLKRVALLLRQALRTTFNHLLKFEIYRQEALKVKTQFERNKKIDDPVVLERVIAATEKKLAEWKHGDPYVPPCRPGGTKYQRNLTNPKEDVILEDW